MPDQKIKTNWWNFYESIIHKPRVVEYLTLGTCARGMVVSLCVRVCLLPR